MGFLKTFGERPGFLPGFLSFCLPGLGQLHQRRVLPALGAFLAFALPLALQPGYPWPLFVAVLAGAEAFRHGQRQSIRTDDSRNYAFAATAICAFVFWAWLVSPVALPLRRQALANARAEALARHLRACAKGNEARMRACVPTEGLRRDPWGGDWSVDWDEEGVTLRSLGADGKPGTRDDLRYRYRIR